MQLTHRYDFVLLFDVKDGNPNGDPDAGNMPRMDAETGQGLVTDVSLKRKVRNYVAMTREYARPFDIYVRERAVLGRAHVQAFDALGIKLGSETRVAITHATALALAELEMPDGVTIDDHDDEHIELVLAADIDKDAAKAWLKEAKPASELKKILSDALKQSKGRRPLAPETESGRRWMCENFFDVRTFGAVMSLKLAPNCGQVRGPVQMTFARSIEPIIASEHSITRMAVATEAEAIKQSGDNRTMGRKHTVPYGLYVAHGFVSAFLANQTGFSAEDLELLFKSLEDMFEHDRSAARGQMATRGLYVFEHESSLGNAHAHALFDRVSVQRNSGVEVARSFSDYTISIDETAMPTGVKLVRRLG